MNNENTTRKSEPAPTRATSIMAGIGMIALFMAILWAVWRFGGIIFQRVTPDQATDRLGVCIIVAAVLHAHFTTKRK